MAEIDRQALDRVSLKIPILSAVLTEDTLAFRRSRPLLGILALALVVAVALPLINITIIFPAYSKLLIATIETGAVRLAAHTIPPSEKYGKLTHQSMESPRLLADIYRLEKNFELLKIGLYSPEGATLYSSDASEITTINKNPQFLRVVAKGGIDSKLGTTTKPGPGGLKKRVDMVITTVPLMNDGEFLGAFEFQFDISDVKSNMDRFNTYATYGSIITSLCILLGVIGLLSKESSRLKALRQADRLRADVDRITRHDLKSPLVGALNGISYLKQYTETNAEQREVLDEMHNTVIVGLDLINRSLDIYKMETGKYQYTPVGVDIASTCHQVAADLSGLAAERNVTIRIIREDAPEDEADALYVAGEEPLCYSLLANLVKNGVEASEPDRTVDIILSSNGEVTIEVHNTGAVPETIRDNFFDKYTTAGKQDGTGLGTYSARLLTRTMGGDITMRSSEEAGTTITVTLPKHDSTETGA
ncbi:sensor histidine kinase [Pseudodesulfovibrio portus]|uniref:histidine kinase n=1 Tax=Pseudodesulfovibrio portus TaxID=231439 RepID=A0ABM8AUB2_9BACT|nr:HAMP domain-containing sensor histidine kinase [Pseudodesulfovibrio portus]BDQ35056.1 hypothetical protein JCM14722_25980 [Pseudodesulfovibrio portus]